MLAKPKGPRGLNRWKKVVTSIGGNSSAIKEPETWKRKGASLCTVRLDLRLRGTLKRRLKRFNIRNKALNRNKIKEVDAVNEAVFEWIVEKTAKEIMEASNIHLVFHNKFLMNDAIKVLEAHRHLITLRSYKSTKTGGFLELEFARQLRRQPTFRRSAKIVASLIDSYRAFYIETAEP